MDNIYSYFLQLQMFLLQALESFLGDIEQWPTTILNHLLIDELTPANIKNVSIFSMGITSPIILLAISIISVVNIVATTQRMLCTVIIISGGALDIKSILLYIIA